jgi:hypothetical protein
MEILTAIAVIGLIIIFGDDKKPERENINN